MILLVIILVGQIKTGIFQYFFEKRNHPICSTNVVFLIFLKY